MRVRVNAEEVLPLRPQKDWVHMDKLEPEKLEWMRDLPAPRKKGTKKVENKKQGFNQSLWVCGRSGQTMHELKQTVVSL